MKREQYDGLELNVVKFNTEETIMMSGNGDNDAENPWEGVPDQSILDGESMKKRKGIAISILTGCVVLCIWCFPFLKKEIKVNKDKSETSIVSPKQNDFLKTNVSEDERLPNAESIDKNNSRKETQHSQRGTDNEITVPKSWNE